MREWFGGPTSDRQGCSRERSCAVSRGTLVLRKRIEGFRALAAKSVPMAHGSKLAAQGSTELGKSAACKGPRSRTKQAPTAAFPGTSRPRSQHIISKSRMADWKEDLFEKALDRRRSCIRSLGPTMPGLERCLPSAAVAVELKGEGAARGASFSPRPSEHALKGTHLARRRCLDHEQGAPRPASRGPLGGPRPPGGQRGAT